MNKKEGPEHFGNSSDLQRQLSALIEQHHKLNREVDVLNTRIHGLSSHESDHLRHIKLRKLKLKDEIESVRTKLELAE
jgi:uncharacterized protein YdcH (DUF465 family)|tara:strand:- start:1741 stop:1974 length:234 start_codon:yes stop_codon:yes gene_type:complete